MIARSDHFVIYYTGMEPGEFKTDPSGGGILVTGIRKVVVMPIGNDQTT